MPKMILVTGATDGIGFATARKLVSQGHHVLLHGRSTNKLQEAERTLSALSSGGRLERYVANLSHMAEVEALAEAIASKHNTLDVLINNAGVYTTSDPVTQDGLDVRFAVNTIAPYLLTQRLLPMLGASGRVINVASAAQSPVNPKALAGKGRLSAGTAYAQSKLAMIMWSRHMAISINREGPAIIAVNPGSLLGSKMVKEAFGMEGSDIQIGSEILTQAALSDEFAKTSGQYFDNDTGRFNTPHPVALSAQKCEEIVRAIEALRPQKTQSPT